MLPKDRSRKRKDGPKPGLHLGVYLVGGFFLMMFSMLCALALFYNGTLPFALPEFIDPDESYGIFRRRLTENSTFDCYPNAYHPKTNIIGAILGIMYIFLALAIVCDEFFVPALEVMAEKMKITPDVAGATLMAAGGSAPELFTNIFATFEESDAGFGTIIGSAVFNVLFVIGMCAMFSKDTLKLTWWPLARDCMYYTIGLGVVALLIGANTKNVIQMGEAFALFIMYFIYIFMMYKNEDCKRWLSKKCNLGLDEVDFPNQVDETPITLDEPEELTGTDTKGTKKSYTTSLCDHDGHGSQRFKQQYTSMIGQQLSLKKTNFRVPGTFRVGIQYLMLNDDKYQSWLSTRAVLDMAGDVKETFDNLDKNKDGNLDVGELRDLLRGIDFDIASEEVDKLMKKLDKNNDELVDYNEFATWYIGSEERIRRDIINLFNRFDSDENGILERCEVTALLKETDKMKRDEINDTIEELFKSKQDGEGVNLNQFFVWYDGSLLFEQHREEAKRHEMVSIGFQQLLRIPEGGFQKFWWLLTLPLMVAFYCTMADVRRVGREKYCYLTFFMSICWIGGFAFFMVDWAIHIGDTLKIPNYIMGMTFLAAGTSIPDLLSSVIVARQGHGDMAVSSSVGSNIFDILVGLPAPWIVFMLVKGKTVRILSCELAVSIIVLIAMLLAVAIAIQVSHWEMSKRLGYSMFVLYFVFLTQDLIRNFSGDPCATTC